MAVPPDPFAVADGRVASERPAAPPVPQPPAVPEPVSAEDVDPSPDVTPDATPEPTPEDPDRPVRPLSREMELPFTPLEARAPQHDHHRAQFSRWAASEITFGPKGRVAATVVMVAIPFLLLRVNIAFILFDGIYLAFLVIGLRHIWQPVMTRPAQHTVIEMARDAGDVSTSPSQEAGT